MSWHRLMAVCWALAWCTPGLAEVVVEEHNEEYRLGIHYTVSPPSFIQILQPSTAGLPYDFDCYDRATGAPATIRSITAAPHIGTVELMVRPHEGRPHGAADIWQLKLDQAGVTGRIVEINISGNLSTDGPTAAASAGTFYVGGNLGSHGLNISGPVDGDITLNGSGPHTGTA